MLQTEDSLISTLFWGFFGQSSTIVWHCLSFYADSLFGWTETNFSSFGSYLASFLPTNVSHISLKNRSCGYIHWLLRTRIKSWSKIVIFSRQGRRKWVCRVCLGTAFSFSKDTVLAIKIWICVLMGTSNVCWLPPPLLYQFSNLLVVRTI